MALSKVPGHSRSQGRSCSYVLPGIIFLCFFFLTAIFLYYKMNFFLSAFKDVVPQLVLAMSKFNNIKGLIDDLASKTLAGHNLISGIIDIKPMLKDMLGLSKDFFSRGLITKRNFLSISRNDLCGSIKSAVDWSNANPSEAIRLHASVGSKAAGVQASPRRHLLLKSVRNPCFAWLTPSRGSSLKNQKPLLHRTPPPDLLALSMSVLM
ncbi:hypothetical protein WN944_028242 [Citrus x changshan-huyou]|uniref:Uncharacterized protein n=1 Tax=Citrus x changshan-huyou TaxID=2935761 RepID=A0AAP0LJ13_9ROSI